jgi:ribosomal-protein-alanine N-acetyltransferase
MGLAHAATRAVLEVRSSNEPAQRLYRQLEFVPVSTRRSYYTNPIEDAVLMAMDPLVMPAGSRHTRIAGGDGVIPAR